MSDLTPPFAALCRSALERRDVARLVWHDRLLLHLLLQQRERNFELAVAASGLSRAAFVRAAVLRQMVALHPYEPLMAQGLATLAACRAAMKSGKAVDDALVRRLDALIEALHLLAEVELR